MFLPFNLTRIIEISFVPVPDLSNGIASISSWALPGWLFHMCAEWKFFSYHSPAIRHKLFKLLLPLSVCSTLHTLLLQLLSPVAFLQDSQCIPTVLWLFSFLIPCWWLIPTGLFMYVSSDSPFLSVFANSVLKSDFWFFRGGFLTLGIIWSHPARSSLVSYLSFMLHNLPSVLFLCLTFSHIICHLRLHE